MLKKYLQTTMNVAMVVACFSCVNAFAGNSSMPCQNTEDMLRAIYASPRNSRGVMFDAALVCSPGDQQLIAEAARYFLEDEAAIKVLDILEDATPADDQTIESVLTTKASCYLLLGRPEEAVNVLKPEASRSIVEQRFSSSLQLYLQAMIGNGDYQEASALFTKIQTWPKASRHPIYFLIQARLDIAEGNGDEALIAIEKVIAKTADPHPALFKALILIWMNPEEMPNELVHALTGKPLRPGLRGIPRLLSKLETPREASEPLFLKQIEDYPLESAGYLVLAAKKMREGCPECATKVLTAGKLEARSALLLTPPWSN